MIPRYTRPEMGKVWSEESRFQVWLDVELAVCEAWHRLGRIPKRDLDVIKRRASFDVKRIAEIEKEVRHDVIAFLTSVAEKVGPSSRFVHLGMTSYDLVDTAFSIQLRKAADIIIDDIKRLLRILKRLAFKYQKTPTIGRTHGIHAEPITFGFKVANFYDEFLRGLERLNRARDVISVCRISGAVGTYAHIPPRIERMVARKFGLKPANISTQVLSRDRHAEFFLALALIASSCEKVAIEIRHLQRTEVGEVEEPFGAGQKGSSAMPHKKNPVLSENITGLARLVRSYAIAALEDVSLWHERDISHSSVERVIAPDATILMDFMLDRLCFILSGLRVYPEKMLQNLDKTHGAIFSGDILLLLVSKGMTREEAYKLVQRLAMSAMRKGVHIREEILEDEELCKLIKRDELEEIFDLSRHTRYMDYIFGKVFGRRPR